MITRPRLALATTATLGLTALTLFLPHAGEVSPLAILPPLVAIALAFITRRVILSLFLGAVAAGAIGGFLSDNAWGMLSGALLDPPRHIYHALSDTWNLQVLAFVVLVLAMVALITQAGGFRGIVLRLEPYARGPRSTRVVTVLLGFIVFIDDYANTMVVGGAMRPLSDRYRISREKLAFLVDATSAPVAGLMVVSTWIGYEVGQFDEVSRSLGLGRDGYAMFFDALGFRFYCLMLLLFVIFNAVSGRDFGPMARAERRALRSAAPINDTDEADGRNLQPARISAWTAGLPLTALLAYLGTGLWLDGGGAARLANEPFAWLSFSAWREVIGAAQNNVTVLMQAGALGLVSAVVCAAFLSKLAVRGIALALWAGVRTAVLPVTVLLLAWTLKQSLDTLHTNAYLLGLLGDGLTPWLFPALVFFIAALTAIATGTSWGTMALLIPTLVPVAYALDGNAYGLITVMTLAAVLDGAILGDHCSPLSDTTILSSAASGCDHMRHVHTQLPYALLVGAAAVLLGYVPAALGVSAWIGIGGAALVFIAVFAGLGRSTRTRASVTTGTEQTHTERD